MGVDTRRTSRSSDQTRFVVQPRLRRVREVFEPVQPQTGANFLRTSIPGVQDDTEVITEGPVALLDRIGPAILVTHSQGGVFSWPARIRTDNVKAIINYEPGGFVFPDDDFPPPVPLFGGATRNPGTPVPAAVFQRLTEIPIQIVWGDFIPPEAQPNFTLEFFRGSVVLSRQIVEAINSRGGNASFFSLPENGIIGNTHFTMGDLNSDQIANLMLRYLHDTGLDKH